MEPKLELDIGNDVGNFTIRTSSGTAYRASRKTLSGTWWVQRFPSPNAGPLWLDIGGPVDRVHVRVGESATFDTGSGYATTELWVISSTVVSIDEMPPEALSTAEEEHLIKYSGLDLTPRTAAEDAAERESLIQRYQKRLAEAPPVTIQELSELLGANESDFRSMDGDALRLAMNTPQQYLQIGGHAVTPWEWLAAGYSRRDVLDVLRSTTIF
jgi:hypothetical protein